MLEVIENGARLPNQPCKFAMLSNWNVDDDPSMAFKPVSSDNLVANAGFEVYYGFNGIYVAQLLMGHVTDLLPISNLDQICVRSRPSSTARVWFAWFY